MISNENFISAVARQQNIKNKNECVTLIIGNKVIMFKNGIFYYSYLRGEQK